MIDILKALAEETRLRIFAQIIKGDMCVCEIEECLELTQSNASRHLTALKRAGILDSYKTAQWAYYKVSDTFITENITAHSRCSASLAAVQQSVQALHSTTLLMMQINL